MHSPFTGIVLALELTHDVNVLLPLLVASAISHGFTALTLRRSILTEKVARRGYHLSRECAVDPLEIVFVREVIRTNIAVLSANLSVKDLGQSIRSNHWRSQGLYPEVDDEGHLTGVLTRGDLRTFLQEQPSKDDGRSLTRLIRANPVRAIRTSSCAWWCTGWLRPDSHDFWSSNATISASSWGLSH